MKAESYALFCLAKMSCHSQALKNRLLKKGYDVMETERVIAKMQNMGYLNDDEWLSRFVQNKQKQGYGSKMIACLLAQKKIDAPAIADDGAALENFIQRKGLDKKFSKEKLVAYLLRRGFCYESICLAIKGP